MSSSALIIGAGSGLSAALARRCAADGMTVALAARTGEKAIIDNHISSLRINPPLIFQWWSMQNKYQKNKYLLE